MKTAYIKLIIAIILDIADFTLGRIMGIGTALDVLFAFIGYLMFGPKGLIQLWEVVDLSDQADGFVPTLTLIALAELRAVKKQQDALISTQIEEEK
ncbi:MAG: hypothetical protein ACWA5L_08530 [bacterium]